MFETRAEARARLEAHVPPEQAALIAAALVPTIAFVPDPARAGIVGGSRVGGTPDLPPGLDWPVQVPPPDADAVAARGSPAARAATRRHFAQRLPYAFLAQADLAEAAALGTVAADLPAEGRLLFFYDHVSGPYDTGTGVCRVIWDRSPRGSLAAQALPRALAEAADAYRAEVAQGFAEHGLTLPKNHADSATPYAGPGRATALAASLRLPDPHAAAQETDPALAELLRRHPADDDLWETLSDIDGLLPESWFGADSDRHRTQLLGCPVPEQDDPRFEAQVRAAFGVQHLSRDDWQAHRAAVFSGARDWRLLFQIAVSDWMQERAEGTVYILMRRDDLAARRFEAAVAVYQQT